MVAGSDVTINLLPGQSRLAQHETLGQARQNLRLVVVFLCSCSFFIIILFSFFFLLATLYCLSGQKHREIILSESFLVLCFVL